MLCVRWQRVTATYALSIMLTLCCCTVSLCYCSSPNSETREYDDDYDDQYDDVQPSVTTGGSDALIDQVSRYFYSYT